MFLVMETRVAMKQAIRSADAMFPIMRFTLFHRVLSRSRTSRMSPLPTVLKARTGVKAVTINPLNPIGEWMDYALTIRLTHSAVIGDVLATKSSCVEERAA